MAMHTTYYIDPVEGHINGDGLTPDTAARDVAPAWLSPGARVTLLYKRGSVVRGGLPKVAGTADAWVRIGAYGEGAKPVFTKSVDLASPDLWERHGASVWRCTRALETCANIIYDDDGAFCGTKRWLMRDLDRPGDWYDEGQSLYVVAPYNPGEYFNAIEWVPSENFVTFGPEDCYITIEDIHIRNAGVHGFWVSGGHHIVLRRCDVSYMGGAVYPSTFGVPEGLTVRYGNAFEIWRQGHDILVEGCRFNQTYDGAVCIQGLRGDVVHNVAVRGCVICNSSFDSFDWSWGVACREVYFENNTAVAAGVGWGIKTEGRPRLSAFLPDSVGWHFFITDVTDPSTICVRNNIFSDAPTNPIMKFRCSPEAMANLTLDYNCYHQPNPRDPLVHYNGTLYGHDEFDRYRAASDKDAHSIVADPRFVEPCSGDWQLQHDSPCLNAGFDTRQSPTFPGMPASQYTGPHIGATAPDSA